MSGLPNVLTICLNTLSLSFHSEDRSNILEFFSATTFSDSGMWAAETHTSHSAAHCHILKAIPSHKSDLIPPILLIQATAVLLSIMTIICLTYLLFLKKLRSHSLAPRSSRALMCNACSCLVHMPHVSDFSQTAPQESRLATVYIVASISSFFSFLQLFSTK